MSTLSLKPVKKNKNNPTPVGFFSCLLNSVNQVHIFHLQAQSLSQHLALGDFYEKIEDLADGIIESYQGKFGIVKGYKSEPYTNIADPVNYLKKLHNEAEAAHTLFTDSDLLNQVDEVKTLLKSTIYKLENLK